MLEKNATQSPTLPKPAPHRLNKAEALDILNATCERVTMPSITRAEADEAIADLKNVILFLRAWYRFMG